MRKLYSYIFWYPLVAIFIMFYASEGEANPGKIKLRVGQRYEVVGTLYAHSVKDDPRSKEISIISVVPLRLRGPEIVSHQLIPMGSILTIMTKAPKKVFGFLYPDRYVVQISGIDGPLGVPVIIDLSRGIEGRSNTLNPEIFKALP